MTIKNDSTLLFINLLIYSLLPAFVKLFGIQAIFVLNIPLIFLLIKIEVKSFVAILCLSFLIILQVTYLTIFSFHLNITAYFEGIFLSVIPMLGCFINKKIDHITLFRAVFYVGFFHACLGFLMYGLIPYPEIIQNKIDLVKEGTAYLRMGSVAGSLIFGVLMALAFNAFLYLTSIGSLNRISNFLGLIIFLAGIMSLQRSCWLAMLIGIIIFTFQTHKHFIIIFILGILLLFLGEIFLSSNKFYYERFITLFTSEGGAIDERFHLWVSAFNYLNHNYMGAGIGQAGIVGYKNEVFFPAIVTDGDYLKIFVETGVVGFLFYISMLILPIILILSNKPRRSEFFLISFILGIMIQMIGSNLTEFYFVNFLLWCSIAVIINKYSKKDNNFEIY